MYEVDVAVTAACLTPFWFACVTANYLEVVFSHCICMFFIFVV